VRTTGATHEPSADDAATRDAESDAVLIGRLGRAGDAHAFDVLYRRHTKALFSTAVRVTGSADVAEDVVHDTWIRAIESFDRFSNRSSFRTWLTGILLNCHRERVREHRREIVEGDLSTDAIDDSSGSEPLDGERIEPLDLEAAVAALSPRYREVFVLHDIEGFTHEEIATMLGLVPGTSKSQLARARQRLRELLEPDAQRTRR
jgi:RNA polymerase sigma-70 factor (ECF subfamily)